MKNSEIEITVRYSEVDAMGIVYYSRYLEYFELGRADWVSRFLCDYEVLESDYKIGLPVIECNIQYKKPAKYSNKIILKTTYDSSQLPKVLHFNYEILKDDQLLVNGSTKHLFYDLNTRKVTSLPDQLRDKLMA